MSDPLSDSTYDPAYYDDLDDLLGTVAGHDPRHDEPVRRPEGTAQLTASPGRGYRVVFVRTYERPVKDLWEAITSPEGLDSWYPTRLRHEGLVGGKVTETFGSVDGTPPPEAPDGVITAYDPPHVFERRISGPEDCEFPGMRGAQTIRTEARAGAIPDTSVLIFTHEFEHKEGALSVLPGWHWCLESLAIEMGSLGDASRAHHKLLQEWYQRNFG